MRKLTLALGLLLAGCGGGDSEDDPAAPLRERSMQRAEAYCRNNGGLKTVFSETHSHSRNGTLIDVGLSCQCANGFRFNTPMRVE